MDGSNQNSRRLWAETRIAVQDGRYRLISLPRAELMSASRLVGKVTSPFAALVLEPAEVSLTMPDGVWTELRSSHDNAREDGPYRVITFDLELDLATTGFLAPVAVRLADAGISIIPQCAFLKDHVLVRESDLSRAVEIIQEWIRQCATT